MPDRSVGYVSDFIPKGNNIQLHDSSGISPGSIFQLKNELNQCLFNEGANV